MQTIGGPIHCRGQPSRTRSDYHQIVKRKLRFGSQSQLARDLGSGRILKKGAVGKYDHRQRRSIGSSSGEEFLSFVVCFDVEPLVGHKVASQKIAHVSGMRRPLVADHAHALKGRMVGRLPIIQHVIDYTIKTLFGRVPRFHQVMVDVRVVDSADSCIRIGISRQERAFGVRVKLDSLLQELHAGHSRHSLVHEEERDRLIAELQLLCRFEGGNAGIRRDDFVTVAVMPAEIALHGPQHVRVVIHCPDHGFGHSALMLPNVQW